MHQIFFLYESALHTKNATQSVLRIKNDPKYTTIFTFLQGVVVNAVGCWQGGSPVAVCYKETEEASD